MTMAKHAKTPWAIYNNGFDVAIVSGLRPAKPDEYSSFGCGQVYDSWICGG